MFARLWSWLTAPSYSDAPSYSMHRIEQMERHMATMQSQMKDMQRQIRALQRKAPGTSMWEEAFGHKENE